MVHTGDVRFDGLTRESAEALLAAADKAGVSRKAVRTDSGGFIVPAEVADALTKKQTAEVGEAVEVPETSTSAPLEVVEEVPGEHVEVEQPPEKPEAETKTRRGRTTTKADKG